MENCQKISGFKAEVVLMDTLNFYIDKNHFPYEYQNDLSFDNPRLLEVLGSANTWMLWTLRTYLEMKENFDCRLTDEIPASGITLFFRGSISLTQKPNKNQFWVCMVADATWHPYSHVNLFQNKAGITKYPQSYFIRHWYQLGIIKSQSTNSSPKNIYYFGDKANLAPELLSDDWNRFVDENEFSFISPHFSEWNNYTDADIVIGIRSFNKGDKFLNKPSSKLINAWRANVVFIGGEDVAYADERETEFDYIDVGSYDDFKTALLKFKIAPTLYQKYRLQSLKCSERFPDNFFSGQWKQVITETIIPLYQQSAKADRFKHYKFLITRFIRYKSEALALRLKKAAA
jgi:hypothetical protein